jgi:hypothetical protein
LDSQPVPARTDEVSVKIYRFPSSGKVSRKIAVRSLKHPALYARLGKIAQGLQGLRAELVSLLEEPHDDPRTLDLALDYLTIAADLLVFEGLEHEGTLEREWPSARQEIAALRTALELMHQLKALPEDAQASAREELHRCIGEHLELRGPSKPEKADLLAVAERRVTSALAVLEDRERWLEHLHRLDSGQPPLFRESAVDAFESMTSPYSGAHQPFPERADLLPEPEDARAKNLAVLDSLLGILKPSGDAPEGGAA